ncbi:cytochrome c biogenesis CcdA family protein [Paracoccus aerodenitrificans]|uniref:cytochrome c biogenesis CcdA family protein n=1 Tax=Paracoccus aerodenitrificans TaxID=3017781 RepID=UPI0022F0DF47|nr:cytochrome c biogenesis protein CcdA [Paracoccus aerodenitrificans]WBU65385.1 cytochrome c biogenesis protein CcdA [Paracoccus aerodenitrificans]
MTEIGFTQAVLAGLASFLTPCILPMLPFYLGLLLGSRPAAMRNRLASGTAFAGGFMMIFLLICLGSTALGRMFLQAYTTLQLLAACGLAVAGLILAGVAPAIRLTGIAVWSGLGLAFGFAWIACVGPTLSAIFRTVSEEMGQGISLLLAYGIGMTAPFILLSLLLPPVFALLPGARSRAMLGGGGLILLACLVGTGSVNRIAQWMLERQDWSALLR